MLKLLRIIALPLALLFMAATAHAESQLALVQQTFQSLRSSDTALKAGDSAKAMALLADIRASVQKLQKTALHFSQQASDAAANRESAVRATNTKYTKLFSELEQKKLEENQLSATLAGLKVELSELDKYAENLDREMEPLRREAKKRRECNDATLWGVGDSECWKLGFQDLTFRWKRLNNEMNDLRTRMAAVWSDSEIKKKHLTEIRGRREALEARIAEIPDEMMRLHREEAALRTMVVYFGTVDAYWKDLASAIGSRSITIDNFQTTVEIFVRRADSSVTAPIFDSYDVDELGTLEKSLVKFASTIDDNTNILLPHGGGIRSDAEK